jgi:hypothetical protein
LVTVDLYGKDGRLITVDLQHASPGGAFISYEGRPGTALATGDVVVGRDGSWQIVVSVGTGTAYNADGARLGTGPAISVLDTGGNITDRVLWAADAIVRTDARVEPESIAAAAPVVEARKDRAYRLGSIDRYAGRQPRPLTDAGSAWLMTELGETGPTTAANHERRDEMRERYYDGYEDACRALGPASSSVACVPRARSSVISSREVWPPRLCASAMASRSHPANCCGHGA